jgi:hypothetical protein
MIVRPILPLHLPLSVRFSKISVQIRIAVCISVDSGVRLAGVARGVVGRL